MSKLIATPSVDVWRRPRASRRGRMRRATVVKIGLILPMTGQQASTGRQIEAAVKL